MTIGRLSSCGVLCFELGNLEGLLELGVDLNFQFECLKILVSKETKCGF